MANNKFIEYLDKRADEKYEKIIIHGGTFHADDVLCAAVAKTLFPDIQVERVFGVTEEMKDDPKTLICDIGGEYYPEKHIYDHHNECPNIHYDGEDTGFKHSAIGLMLQDYIIQNQYKKLTGRPASLIEDLNLLDDRYGLDFSFSNVLRIIEIKDNGQYGFGGKFDKGYRLIEEEDYEGYWGYEDIFRRDGQLNSIYFDDLIPNLVSSMNPLWDENKNTDEAFSEAVDLIQEKLISPLILGKMPNDIDDLYDLYDELNDKYFERKKLYDKSQKSAETIVTDALSESKDGVVELPQCCPWQEVLCPSDAKFVVYPSNRGGYNLQCIPPEVDSFEKKIELPDWSKNKPEGMTFEHPSKFLASFETKEQALNAAKSIPQLSLNQTQQAQIQMFGTGERPKSSNKPILNNKFS